MADRSSEPPAALLELARRLADAVERLAATWTEAPLSVTPRLSAQQLRALEGVNASPGINLTGLADAVDMGVPAASRLCDRLEAAGLLERGASSQSRREIHLTATSRGRDLLDKVAAQRRHDLAVVLAELPPERRAELLAGLQALPPLSRTHPESREP